jgi:hypothetical protein
MSKKKETVYSIFIDALHAHAKEPIYLAKDTSDLSKEIFENTYQVSVPPDVLADLDPLTLSVWLEVVRTNAKKQVTAEENNNGVLYYCWYDIQAGQLRYNFIHPLHKEPPFTGTLKYVNDNWAVCKAFLDGLQKQEYPANNEIIIFKQLLKGKTSFEFKSYTNWGPIQFGMHADDVRKLLDIKYDNIKREETSTDYFDDAAFMVEYNKENKVISIQITKDAQAIWEGLELLGETASKVRKYVERKGYKIHLTKEGSYYKDLGLYFASNDRLGSVMLFAKGYYEEIENIM